MGGQTRGDWRGLEGTRATSSWSSRLSEEAPHCSPLLSTAPRCPCRHLSCCPWPIYTPEHCARRAACNAPVFASRFHPSKKIPPCPKVPSAKLGSPRASLKRPRLPLPQALPLTHYPPAKSSPAKNTPFRLASLPACQLSLLGLSTVAKASQHRGPASRPQLTPLAWPCPIQLELELSLQSPARPLLEGGGSWECRLESHSQGPSPFRTRTMLSSVRSETTMDPPVENAAPA